MTTTHLSTAQLKSLISLSERRERLLGELGIINSEIDRILGAPKSAPAPTGAPSKTSRRTRGALTTEILAAVKKAGSKGVAVKDMAKQLGKTNQHLHVWFSTTGKKHGLQKIGRGQYGLGSR